MDKFEELLGKTITKIDGGAGDGQMVFHLSDGSTACLYHSQDCCESVDIEEIIGDLYDLVGHPLTQAEEVVNRSDGNEPLPEGLKHDSESSTWTFYKLATVKGYVTVRWFGCSNGYYSETVDFRHEPAHG